MSTLKYKATERYSMGWTDPRGVLGTGPQVDELRYGLTLMSLAEPFADVPTSTLRNLWMARWGSRAVLVEDVRLALEAKEPVLGAMRALSDRKLVRYEKVTDLRRDEDKYYYTLEREDGDR